MQISKKKHNTYTAKILVYPTDEFKTVFVTAQVSITYFVLSQKNKYILTGSFQPHSIGYSKNVLLKGELESPPKPGMKVIDGHEID